MSHLALLLAISWLVPSTPPVAPERDTPETCRYSSYQWHRAKRRAVNRKNIRKSYSAVRKEERSPDDPRCTLCLEDQVEVAVAGVKPVRVCWVYAASVQKALDEVVASGFKVEQLDGYRAGKTRGPLVDGLRTVWSNHSFGTAIDINKHRNGIFTNCKLAGDDLTPKNVAEKCRKTGGGAWDPERHPNLTITREGGVYRALTQSVGWKWGGEIPGRLKDFMHFSITGF